jgi:hypothetical protein
MMEQRAMVDMIIKGEPGALLQTQAREGLKGGRRRKRRSRKKHVLVP